MRQASLLASQQEVCASLLKPSRPAREPPLMSVVPGQARGEAKIAEVGLTLESG